MATVSINPGRDCGRVAWRICSALLQGWQSGTRRPRVAASCVGFHWLQAAPRSGPPWGAAKSRRSAWGSLLCPIRPRRGLSGVQPVPLRSARGTAGRLWVSPAVPSNLSPSTVSPSNIPQPGSEPGMRQWRCRDGLRRAEEVGLGRRVLARQRGHEARALGDAGGCAREKWLYISHETVMPALPAPAPDEIRSARLSLPV